MLRRPELYINLGGFVDSGTCSLDNALEYLLKHRLDEFQLVQVTLQTKQRRRWWGKRYCEREKETMKVFFLGLGFFVTARGEAGIFSINEGWVRLNIAQLPAEAQPVFWNTLIRSCNS